MGNAADDVRLLVPGGSGGPFHFRAAVASQREPQPPRGAGSSSLRSGFRPWPTATTGACALSLGRPGRDEIAGPYFNPYMLGELRFSASLYVTIVAASIVGKILFLPTIGRIAARVGTRCVLSFSAAAIVPSSALWLVSSHWGYLIAVPVLRAWLGGFDLATLLLFFETIPRQKRVAVLAVFNMANSAAIAAGSLLGAGILVFLGGSARGLRRSFRRLRSRAGGDHSPGSRAGGKASRSIVALPPPHYLRPMPARAMPRPTARGESDNLIGLRPYQFPDEFRFDSICPSFPACPFIPSAGTVPPGSASGGTAMGAIHSLRKASSCQPIIMAANSSGSRK